MIFCNESKRKTKIAIYFQNISIWIVNLSRMKSLISSRSCNTLGEKKNKKTFELNILRPTQYIFRSVLRDFSSFFSFLYNRSVVNFLSDIYTESEKEKTVSDVFVLLTYEKKTNFFILPHFLLSSFFEF